jgi:hypothetical protein
MRCYLVGFAALFFLAAPAAAADPPKKEETYRVPYQLTETKHILIRVKINGKGPFNLIVDTGAPALFLGTEAAKKAGVAADNMGWGTFDSFEIEGGIKLDKTKARIEDPFQLLGMNKMNLPGIRYDGMLGYTVLAQFRITYDFTQPHLEWTKIDWTPPPPVGLGGSAPELSGMGAMVQLVAALVGRRPDPDVIFRGYVGLELAEEKAGLVVKSVLAGSPASQANVKPGDRIVGFRKKSVKTLDELRKLAADQKAGSELEFELQRGGEKINTTVKPIQGL